jgi:hypothetical protein
LGDFHSAAVADYSPEADSFVFTAVALPVFDRAEYPLAEEPISFRLEGPVIDGLRLGHFAIGPGTDGLRRSQLNPDSLKIARLSCGSGGEIYHFRTSFGLAAVSAVLLKISAKTFFKFFLGL